MRNNGWIFCVSLLAAASLAAMPAQAQSKKQMTLATASIGGAYYPMGQAMATVINQYVPQIQMTPEVTNGAVENLRLVGEGNTDFGITNANMAYFAYHGEKPYNKKIGNIAALGNLHPSVFQIVVLSNSTIKSISDLKGKKVAVGPAGGGTLPLLRSVLAEYDMKMDDIRANYLPYTDGFTQLGDGNLDAAVALGGYPTAAIVEIATRQKIRLIVPKAEKFAALIEKYPYYSKIVIPKDVYKQDVDIPCVGINNIFFTKKSMDAQLIYEITKALYGHLDELAAANATARQIDRISLAQTPIPLHPGAKRYFDEKKK